MLTTSTRPYTDLEFDTYAECMSMRDSGESSGCVPALFVGFTLAFITVVVMLYKFSGMPGTTQWTIVGGVALLGTLATWALSSRISAVGDNRHDPGDWTDQPPESATEIIATADAAWILEGPNLTSTFVVRVEPDRYFVLHQAHWTVPFDEEVALDAAPSVIASRLHVVLLGEGEHCIAVDVALSEPMIACNHVELASTSADPAAARDIDDGPPCPDGVFAAADLPAAIRHAINT
ncbi:MAG: hypothetical protein SFY96_04325 [Planctomycetota bacterium]|nr:hypothetical protein [Planctomycetota bacterium]